MKEHNRAVIQSAFEASNQGEIQFSQTMDQLMGAGVESYHVDFRSGTTYFRAEGIRASA